MSIYSETTSNTSRDETHLLGENCYTCDNDCPGIILEIFKENSFERETHVQYLISGILVDEKHYYLANYATHIGLKCLVMYYQEGQKFKRNMEKLGYQVTVVRDSFKRYSAHILIHKDENLVDPADLIHVFRELEVIK